MYYLKWTAQSKLKIHSSFSQRHELLIYSKWPCCSFPYNESEWWPWSKSFSKQPLSHFVWLLQTGTCHLEHILVTFNTSLEHSTKCMLLCPTKERNSHWFGTTWGWINDDRIFFFFDWLTEVSLNLLILLCLIFPCLLLLLFLFSSLCGMCCRHRAEDRCRPLTADVCLNVCVHTCSCSACWQSPEQQRKNTAEEFRPVCDSLPGCSKCWSFALCSSFYVCGIHDLVFGSKKQWQRILSSTYTTVQKFLKIK